MGKMIELKVADGHPLSAYRADPAGQPRGGIVVIQEIFGVNSHIKSVADGFARDGYVAIAPAMFDRVQIIAEFAAFADLAIDVEPAIRTERPKVMHHLHNRYFERMQGVIKRR